MNLIETLKRARDYGLGLGTLQCLVALHDGPQTMGDLARDIGVSTAAVTGAVDSLEGPGWVCRFRDDDDRRTVKVRLTERGIEMAGMILNHELQHA